ncbi:MAG: hypothetical protein HY360_27425 [Verrucomicrobia bacterium]|nr:hypothetical protein [Verrucomicrobiota bacterium]
MKTIRSNAAALLFCLGFATALRAEELLIQGQVEIPISGDEIHVFQFSTQKIHKVKRSDYASEDAWREAFKKLGDLYVTPRVLQSGEPYWFAQPGYVTCFKSQWAFYPMLIHQFEEHFRGSDFSSVGKTKSPFNITHGTLFGLDTQNRNNALILVDEVKDQSVVLNWIYRTDGKLAFPQLPGQKLEGIGNLADSAFNQAAQLIDLRKLKLARTLEGWRDFDSPAYRKMASQIPKGQDIPIETAGLIMLRTQALDSVGPGTTFFALSQIRSPLGIPAALAEFEQRCVGGDEKTLAPSDNALRAMGRAASAAIVQRLLKPEKLSPPQVAGLKTPLENLEGKRRAEWFMTHPPPVDVAPETLAATGKAPAYRFFAVARPRKELQTGDPAEMLLISLSKGGVTGAVKLGKVQNS